jgi:DNA-binding NtrC family response regulator
MTENQKILLVEDDPKILESLSEILSDYYRVEKTSSLAHAWKILQEEPFGYVIMDLHIPPYLDDRDSGIYLFDKIKRNFKNTHVIIISAHANPQHKEMFTNENAVFIEKPFSTDEVLNALKSFN